MEDIKEKLLELLQNGEAAQNLKDAAQTLFENKTDTSAQEDKKEPDIDIGALIGMISAMNSMGDDSRSALLLALKPHLSADRQKKVDNAVKLLRLVPLLPLIKQLFGEG